MLKKYLFMMMLVILMSACSNVKPWQKAALAKPEMQWVSDSTDFKLANHIYFSKEGSSGGEIAVGGGCGCN